MKTKETATQCLAKSRAFAANWHGFCGQKRLGEVDLREIAVIETLLPQQMTVVVAGPNPGPVIPARSGVNPRHARGLVAAAPANPRQSGP